MRILILTDGIFPFEIGGMQKHAHYMSKYFIKAGIDVTIYHCVTKGEIPPDVHQQLARSLGIESGYKFVSKCFKFPHSHFRYPGHYIRASYKYSKLLYRELLGEPPFDFIYAKGLTGWYSLENKSGLPPIGVQLHGLEMFQPSPSVTVQFQKKLLQRAAKFNLLKADYVFSYGGKILRLHKEIGCTDKQLVIQHGGIERRLVIEEKDIVASRLPRRFLFIGRYERRKGYEELRSALESLVGKYRFHVSFVGDMPESKQLASEQFSFLGTIRDIASYYKVIDEHDVLLVPSLSEGLPTVLIESMARGLVPVATDVGAVSSIVGPGNGLLIEPGNVDQLRNAIVRVLEMSEEELLEKKKNARRMIVENFDWENLSAELLNFIKRVI